MGPQTGFAPGEWLDEVRRFATDPEGQALLEDIETFGLPGVEDASDLTEPQFIFLQEARRERFERTHPTE